MKRRIVMAAAAALLFSLSTPADGQEAPSPDAVMSGRAREIVLFAGAAAGAGEIGRGVNLAGGDALIASLGTSPVIGGRFGFGNGLVSVGATVLAWLRSVGVQNEAGVEFPHHGKPPLLYTGEVRLYPFRNALAGGRVSPYVEAGFGGALLSTDLDNVNGQELHHLWARRLGGGVAFRIGDGTTLVEVQVTGCSLLGQGALAAFTLRSVVFGVGRRW